MDNDNKHVKMVDPSGYGLLHYLSSVKALRDLRIESVSMHPDSSVAGGQLEGHKVTSAVDI
jgi:hypothetical protein